MLIKLDDVPGEVAIEVEGWPQPFRINLLDVDSELVLQGVTTEALRAQESAAVKATVEAVRRLARPVDHAARLTDGQLLAKYYQASEAARALGKG